MSPIFGFLERSEKRDPEVGVLVSASHGGVRVNPVSANTTQSSGSIESPLRRDFGLILNAALASQSIGSLNARPR